MKRTWTDYDLIEAVKVSRSYSEVTRCLGISDGSGGSITNVKRGIERLGLDLTHWSFDPKRTNDTKQCSDCKEFKSYQEFFRATKSKDGFHNYCKNCKRERQWEWTLKTKFGIVREDYDRLILQQNNQCAICGTKDPGAVGGGSYGRWFIDHCHKTGKNRGLLCSSCNLGLGKFGDNPQLLEEAAVYLRRW